MYNKFLSRSLLLRNLNSLELSNKSLAVAPENEIRRDGEMFSK